MTLATATPTTIPLSIMAIPASGTFSSPMRSLQSLEGWPTATSSSTSSPPTSSTSHPWTGRSPEWWATSGPTLSSMGESPVNQEYIFCSNNIVHRDPTSPEFPISIPDDSGNPSQINIDPWPLWKDETALQYLKIDQVPEVIHSWSYWHNSWFAC